MKIYLIVECNELSDQYECDADRIPTLILINPNQSDLKKFKYGYEIYETSADGHLEKIQNYDIPFEDGDEEILGQ